MAVVVILMLLSPLIFLSQACVTDVVQPRLVTSARQHWDPCSVPKQTQQITGRGFWISLQSDWQIDKAFLTGQSWPVFKSWYKGEGREQGFRHCFTDRLNQSLVSSKQKVTCYLSKLFLSAFYFVCFLFYFKFSAGTSQKTNQYRW